MTDIITQFSHIFIHYYSNKAASTCKLFVSEPNRLQEDKMGRLFGVLEINTPSRENAQIITRLISYLEDSYYSQFEDRDIDIETAFERSLDEVNQKFAQLIKEKQIYLVGNLNEITIREKINLSVGVIKENNLLLTYLNNIGLFLIHKTKQDYKLVDIRKVAQEENNNEKKNELSAKLFSNLIRGEINPPDYFFVANTNFLNYISLERTQKIITSLPIHKAAEYFKNALLQFEGCNFAAIIIKNSTLEQKDTKESASLTSITELNYTESSTEKLLSPSFWTIIKGSLNFTKNLFIKEKDYSKEDKAENEKIEIEATENYREKPSIDKIASNKNIFKKLLGLFGAIFIKTKKIFKNLFTKTPLLDEKWQKIKSFLRLQLAHLGGRLKKIPNLSKILLIIAVLLIILFVYSTSYFKQQQIKEADSKEFQYLATQIEDKKNQADSNLIYGNEDQAKLDITEAQKLLSGLVVKSQKQKDRQEQLSNSIEEVIAKLRHITTISEPILITDLATEQENNINIQNIIYLNNQILAFDSLENTTYQIDLETRKTNKIYSNLSDIGKLLKAKRIEDKILLYHDKNGFIQFKDSKFTPLSVNLPANSLIADFADYSSKLYTLDLNSSQIYRHPKADSIYGPGVIWLKENIDLKNIVSLGIDTNIWILDKTGQILKLNKGRKQSFSTKNLEPVLEAPSQLFTNDETNYLYILEPKNKRIVVLDKEGNLITQYYSQVFENLKGFEVVEKEKKMFVINDNKIYFFNLTY